MTLRGKDILSPLKALTRVRARPNSDGHDDEPRAGDPSGVTFVHSTDTLAEARAGDRLVIVGELVFTLLGGGDSQPPGDRFIAQPDRPAGSFRWRFGKTGGKIKVWVNKALFRNAVPMHRFRAFSMLDYYTTWAMAQRHGLIAIGGYSPEEDGETEEHTILYVLAVDEKGTVVALDEQSLPSQRYQEDYFYSELTLLLEELGQNYPEYPLAWLAPLAPCPKTQRMEYAERFPAGFEYVDGRLFEKTRPAHRIRDPEYVSFSERYGLSFAIVILALLIPIVPYWQLYTESVAERENFESARQRLHEHIQSQLGPVRANTVPLHPDAIKQRKVYIEKAMQQSQRLGFLFHFLSKVAKIEDAIVREVEIPLRFSSPRATVYLGDDPRLKYDPGRVIRMDIALPSEEGRALEQGEELLEALHRHTHMTLFIRPAEWVEEKINEHDYRRYTLIVPF
uniref:Pilin accessory protein (PilO) n=1 Tax=Candidatus Kentrum sp. FM TaxID=2126340 RepID=A0A450VRT8_9GAMM|nr:MAG: hypothetical protein BECKFM1743C_GA0114222_105253 [Candidatus Kentron sp. FM]VFJ70863.1 MAG: hypothetical protein BECKFM1743A_GA0114220_105643 [Candidatus Kentron sp. FM]VFK07486.1 MAG: hypothetical protein BECKFM1743B_GA0114221_1004110 [Candidatus Kentron sp. FM]